MKFNEQDYVHRRRVAPIGIRRPGERSAARSVAEDSHENVRQDAKSQAQGDHAANFGKDLAGSRTGVEIFHEKWPIRLVRSGQSERVTMKVAHSVLERGDRPDIGALPV